jgi:hypothetical protein
MIPLWNHSCGRGTRTPDLKVMSLASYQLLPSRYVVLRTGLEPVSSPVKGECPNQLDERSIFIFPKCQITFNSYSELLCKDTK